ncbi:MAG: response regulator transcription factor [Anaerolineae bacterium]|jgi:DNA-binding response OmpR family regulator|nr:response regulator transcription factor [Anaerolineae bacterium]
MYRILIADDDNTTLQMVEEILDLEGYIVYTADNVNEVLDLAQSQPPDLFLLDLALGQDSGIDLCRQLRLFPDTSDTPILFLTGQFESQYAVAALEAGADDYIRKPFAVKELVARVRANLRRVPSNTKSYPLLSLYPDTQQVFLDSKEIFLTKIEFNLLHFMVMDAKRWHATEDLLSNVWNYTDGTGDTALVRNHIRNLRRKIEVDPDHPTIIQSRHGRGYIVRAQVLMNTLSATG